jgi:MADS-box transcription factor
MNIDTPVSALPSRFLGDGLLPSPSSFYADWGLKGNEHNTLSPLTWQTPVVGTGPSFLRDDLPPLKRKSPDLGNSSNNGGNGGDQQQGEGSSEQTGNDAKRVKVE